MHLQPKNAGNVEATIYVGRRGRDQDKKILKMPSLDARKIIV